MKNYYETLGVQPGCDAADIREAYRRLVQQNLWNKETFTELKEAYDVLTSPSRREEYDRELSEGTAKTMENAEVGSNGVEMVRRCPMGTNANCPIANGKTPVVDGFCPECGVDIATLPLVPYTPEGESADIKWYGRFEEETGRMHRLVLGENIVGREGAHINLPDKTVSRAHARIQVAEDKSAVLEDLGSTNGTQVNGERMAPHTPRPLIDGDTVRFGSIRLRYRSQDTPLARDMADPSDFSSFELPPIAPMPPMDAPVLSSPEPVLDPIVLNPLERLFRAPLGTAVNARAKLVATRGDMISEHPLIDGVTTFGRRADSTIVLRNDPYVSGSHAQIIGEGDVFRLIDVGSTNGTLLNGERLLPNQPETLKQGDEIVIGGTIFRFEMNAYPGSPS